MWLCYSYSRIVFCLKTTAFKEQHAMFFIKSFLHIIFDWTCQVFVSIDVSHLYYFQLMSFLHPYSPFLELGNNCF